jgi:hypothetical protein
LVLSSSSSGSGSVVDVSIFFTVFSSSVVPLVSLLTTSGFCFSYFIVLFCSVIVVDVFEVVVSSETLAFGYY